ncbi:MAG: SDR family NAD(P)-dependent oxidoreductase [Bryobacterales bacterium]|nr:SDR family NAD(P)-dependent oxidoreductase [Bryobacterales bacterium]MDE0293655.1 SDR family NAD(P)-dependent oxidoreductase [Bryobacterales bacterium]
MFLRDKVVIVTGGAHGIGRALCERFAAEGARGVVVADIDDAQAAGVASAIGGLAVPTDVTSEASIQDLVRRTRDEIGPIDLFCSNAGIMDKGGLEVSDEDWDRMWRINFRAHLYAARAVVPAMVERGRGYLLSVASAAGLLTQIGAAPYTITKHAAVALAEWLAVTYGDAGIKVSCLCPQGVRTRLLANDEGPLKEMLTEIALAPEEVADSVVKGLEEERFLILPHPEVAEYLHRKADDHDRWLRGMRRLQKKVSAH